MTLSAPVSRPTSAFDAFLFASIGDEKNGMLLSVLSAFARLDVDPWLEAANLARMPVAAATERMISLIASLPDRPSAQQDSATIAARLIALLPHGGDSQSPVGAISVTAANSRIILFVIFIGFLLGAQLFMASRQPPVPAAGARTPASSSVAPPVWSR